MKAASLLAVVLVAIPGWGLEFPHAVLLPGEPLEALLPMEEGPPELIFCGEAYPASWTVHPSGGQALWRAQLPADLPAGIWLLQHNSECTAFLRAPEGWAVLVLVGAEGAFVSAPGLVVLRGQEVEVAGPAGDWKLHYQFPGQETRELAVSLSPGERRQITLGYVNLSLSTPTTLPGYEFLLQAEILSPVGLPSTAAGLQLPPGWQAQPAPCQGCPPTGLEPIPAGVVTMRAWRIRPPQEALGSHTLVLALEEVGLRGQVTVEVAYTLPVEVVVAHWNLAQDELDLTLPPKIEYEQLLWAVSFLGRELPHTGRVLTRGELERLAQLWQEGG